MQKFTVRAFLAVSAVVVASSQAAKAADVWAVDAVHSSVVFRVKHMNTSHAWGRFNSLAGSITLDSADPAQSKVAFTIKANSVDTNNKARDAHLMSPDFFSAVQYPNITFASESVTKSARGYEVIGSLTFHGVTKPLAFVLVPSGSGKDMKGGEIAGFDASFVVKQSDFGITKMAAAIGDEVSVYVSLEVAKK
jgi:polyisoprenoid-binding protein YceI